MFDSSRITPFVLYTVGIFLALKKHGYFTVRLTVSVGGGHRLTVSKCEKFDLFPLELIL